MDNILDIVYSYSINKILLDENAIKSIIDTCIDIYNIDSLREVKFTNGFVLEDNFVIANYNIKGYINIYNDAIEKEIDLESYKTYFNIEKELNEKELFLRKNLHLLYIILHEIEHSKQIDKIKYYDESFERKLLYAEFSFIYPKTTNQSGKFNINYFESLKNKLIVDKYYDISIMERLADVNSLENIKNLSISLSNNLYNLQKLILLDKLLREYKDYNDSPTKRFFKIINSEEILENTDNLEFNKRLKYGLSLTKNEYNSLIKKLK